MRKAQRTDFIREIKKSINRFLSILCMVAMGVAFYAGIRSAEPDMDMTLEAYYSEADMMDIRVLGTLGVTEEDVDAIRNIPGITAAEGGYQAEVIWTVEEQEEVVTMYSLADDMNRLTVKEGRVPKAPDECFLDEVLAYQTGYGIGDTITVDSGTEDDISKTLGTNTYRVVGIGTYAWYLSWARGSASIGDGSADGFLVVPKESFSMPSFTTVFAKIDANEAPSYSKSYETAMDSIRDAIEGIAGERCEIRYGNVVEDARNEIADGEQQISDAEQKLADALEKLLDGERKFDEGLAEFEKGEKELADGWSELKEKEKELEEAKAELKKAREELDAAHKQAVEGKAQLLEAKKSIREKEKEILAAKKVLAESKRKLDDGRRELDKGWDAYNQLKSQLPVLKGTVATLEGMDQTITTLEDNVARIEKQIEDAEAIGASEEVLAVLRERLKTANDALKRAVDLRKTTRETLVAQIKEVYPDFDITADDPDFTAKVDELFTKAEEQLPEMKKELDKQEANWNSGKAEWEKGESELLDGELQLQDGKALLEEKEDELNNGLWEMMAGETQYQTGMNQILDGQTQLEAGRKKLQDSEKELESARAEMEAGKQELLDARAQYEEAKAKADEELPDAKQELVDAKEEIDKLEIPEWYVLDRESIQSYVEYRMDADRIGAIGKVFPVIFFLVAALVSLTTMTRMVEEERTQIGTMKALGYSRWAIASKYILYALSATFGGAVIGVIIGSKFLPKVIIDAYGILYNNLPMHVIPIQPGLAISSVLIAVACTVLATLAACYKELLSTPAQLMRPVAPKQGKRVLLERVTILWKHLSFTQKSTLRNLFRYKKRFLMTVFGIGGCMALLMVGYGLRDSIQAIVNNQYTNIFTFDAYVNIEQEEPRAEKDNFAQEVEAGDDVNETILIKQTSYDVEANGTTKNMTLFVPETLDRLEQFVQLQDRITDEEYVLDDKGVIITEKLASMLGVKVGDTIRIKSSETRQHPVTITAITENYVYHYVYMTPALYQEVFGEEPEYNYLFLRLSEEAKQEEDVLASELLKNDIVRSYTSVKELEGSVADMMQALDSVVWVLVISAALLAFVVMYNLNNINITERKRELATLKVLGFYDIEVAEYVYRENIYLMLFGIAAGVAMGIGLHQFVIRTCEVDMVMFGRVIQPLSYVYSIALTVVFTLAVNVSMFYKLKKIDMIESLKGVE